MSFLFYLLILKLGKQNDPDANNISSYLDIYKNDGKIVFQLSNDKDISEIADYINFLKDQKINLILLNNKGKLIYEYQKGVYKFNQQIDLTQEKINNILLFEENLEFLIENKIEFISKNKLKEILDGKHNKIKIEKNSELYKKLEKIYSLLEKGISKVTLTKTTGIRDEIEGLGAGIMFVDLEKVEFKILKNKEIFYQIYKEKVLAGEWKAKNDEKLEKISSNYKVLEINGTILGGYYLGDFEKEINGEKIKGQLLENLFSTKNGGGIGKQLAKKIKQEKLPIFAYSKQEGFFQKIGFEKVKIKRNIIYNILEKLGILEKKFYKSETGADLWIYKKS